MLTKNLREGVRVGFIKVHSFGSDFQLHKMKGLFTHNISFFIEGFGIRRQYLTIRGKWKLIGNTVASGLKEEEWKEIGAKNALAGLLFLTQEKLDPRKTVILLESSL